MKRQKNRGRTRFRPTTVRNTAPEQPGRGVKARLVAEPAQAVIGQRGQGQVDAAVHQGQRVDDPGLHRAHEGQGQQEGQEVVFQGLQPAVAIGLHPAGQVKPPPRHPAGGLVDRAQGAGKAAEEPAHHQGAATMATRDQARVA